MENDSEVLREDQSEPVNLPSVPIGSLQAAASEYRGQLDQATQALRAIEERREMLGRTIDTLTGAITAIELLIPKE